jgi:succinate dehydrogenase / fumarate reductase membrane anchor subunit
MLFFIIFFLVHFLIDPPTSYRAWHDWVLSREVGVAASVFVLALLAHAWVGVRDVVMDYVHPVVARVLVLAVVGLGLTGIGASAIRILWQGLRS